MADRGLRELERRFRETGEGRERLVQAYRRLGDQAALCAMGVHPHEELAWVVQRVPLLFEAKWNQRTMLHGLQCQLCEAVVPWPRVLHPHEGGVSMAGLFFDADVSSDWRYYPDPA